MNILLIFLLLFAVVLFILVVINVPVPQKVVNLVLLAFVIIAFLSFGGWINLGK